MIVEEIMNKDIHTLSPQHTVRDAVKLMREYKIRHIPIVNDENNVLGIVTDYDLNNVLPSCLREETESNKHEIPLAEVMTKNPLVGHPLDFVEEVAVTFYEAKISCLPIVSANVIVGIVTTTDLLYSYIELTGSNKPGSKIDIRVDDRPGMLYEITKVFHAYNANVLSVLVYPDGDSKTTRILSVRLQVINPLPIIETLRKLGYNVLWPHLPGITL